MTTEEQNSLAKDLGASLRKARGAMTQTEFAERAEWGSSGKTKVSKIEGGKQLPTETEINLWADITSADDRVRRQWKALADRAAVERSAGYAKRMSNGQAKIQQEYNDRAEETTSFRFFETYVFPRYLQVPQYTRAVIEEYHDKFGTINDVDQATEVRQQSTRYLYDINKTFVFVIDECVLRRRRFPPSVMRPQLDRLLSVIGLSNVTLAIYPSLSRPVSTLTESSFELFDDIGYIETVLEDDRRLLAEDVMRLEATLDRYMADAVTDDEARQLILDAIAALPAE